VLPACLDPVLKDGVDALSAKGYGQLSFSVPSDGASFAPGSTVDVEVSATGTINAVLILTPVRLLRFLIQRRISIPL